MKWIICLIACALFLAGCSHTQSESVSPKTALFRSGWKNGQRAKVTEDLIALLKVGMIKDQVASILERPSRPSDGITRDGDSERWTFTITLGRILILTFDGDTLINIDGG
jgi:outer membrane protein assembly factor BamE (lipoprotein component of BamABCDE complex)